jgi:hypothetical protein
MLSSSGIITRVNHIKSSQVLVTLGYPLSTYVRGVDTMSDHTLSQEQPQTIPYGYCQCGCGQPAPIATSTNAAYGSVKGKPQRYIRGHNGTRPVAERFWEKVARRDDNECWEWTGATRQFGYGSMRGEKGTVSAHRFSYELHYGPIPDGMHVCHSCDNPPCVNPGHLFLGDGLANTRDMDSKGRRMNPDRKGEFHSQAKLTASQVIKIRQLAQEGKTSAELGRQYKMADSTIRAIVRRRLWRHIP